MSGSGVLHGLRAPRPDFISRKKFKENRAGVALRSIWIPPFCKRGLGGFNSPELSANLPVFPARTLPPKLRLGNTIRWKLYFVFVIAQYFFPMLELGKELVNQ